MAVTLIPSRPAWQMAMETTRHHLPISYVESKRTRDSDRRYVPLGSLALLDFQRLDDKGMTMLVHVNYP